MYRFCRKSGQECVGVLHSRDFGLLIHMHFLNFKKLWDLWSRLLGCELHRRNLFLSGSVPTVVDRTSVSSLFDLGAKLPCTGLASKQQILEFVQQHLPVTELDDAKRLRGSFRFGFGQLGLGTRAGVHTRSVVGRGSGFSLCCFRRLRNWPCEPQAMKVLTILSQIGRGAGFRTNRHAFRKNPELLAQPYITQI